jgi:hypothetical protein
MQWLQYPNQSNVDITWEKWEYDEAAAIDRLQESLWFH